MAAPVNRPTRGNKAGQSGVDPAGLDLGIKLDPKDSNEFTRLPTAADRGPDATGSGAGHARGEPRSPQGSLLPGPPGGRQEVLLLDESDLVVTDRRIVVGRRRTFLIEHLVSTERGETRQNWSGPIALIVAGSLLTSLWLLALSPGLVGGLLAVSSGGVCVATGVVAFRRREPTPRLKLTFSSGQRHVILDEDPAFIVRVSKAIAKAAVRRR